MFIDSANILVRSGKGGDGCVAFHREKFVAKGGPSGGNGGNGGSVVLVADEQVETLMDFAGRHHWFADDGQQGGSKGMSGKKGEDLEIHLPVGTLVYENPPEMLTPKEPDPDDPERILEEIFMTGQERAAIAQVRSPQPGEAPSGPLMVDLSQPGMRYAIAGGGRGGFGNEHFKSSTNQTPREASPGEPAVEFYLRLELKLIADVGLLGKPNAGKSTFINQVSNAKAKVGHYAFTTLVPKLGVVTHKGREFVLADIPGLIEGAAEGAGIGDRFLGHIERCRVLIHLIDISGDDPAEAYRTVNAELEAYGSELADKPQVVALNKLDLADDELGQGFAEELLAAGADKVFTISGATGAGIPELLDGVLGYLPDRTSTETHAEEVEDEDDTAEWSPL